jgi:hypothetical protein
MTHRCPKCHRWHDAAIGCDLSVALDAYVAAVSDSEQATADASTAQHTNRRSCAYEAFIPAALADLRLQLPGDVAGSSRTRSRRSQTSTARAGPEPASLARLLLRPRHKGNRGRAA